MGIRNKEKERQEIKSNVGAIIGIEDKKDKTTESVSKDLTQKSYYITKAQYQKLRILSVNRDKDMSFLIREMLDKYLS